MAEEQNQEGEGAQMSLIGHLTELRNRLGVAVLAFVVLFLIAVAPMPGGGFNNSVASHVFMFLQAPLAEILEEKGGGRMIFTALHEGFFTQIKVGFFTALCISFDPQHPDLEVHRAGSLPERTECVSAISDCHAGAVRAWRRHGLLRGYANGVELLYRF